METEKYKDHTFHYSRDERLSMQNVCRPMDTEKSIFKRNKSLIVILIDIGIIALVAFIFYQFLNSASYQADIAGYSLTLRGFPVKDKVIVSLRLEKNKETASSGMVFIRFYMDDKELNLSKELPEKKGDLIEAAGSLPVFGLGGELKAEIQIGQDHLILSRKLDEK